MYTEQSISCRQQLRQHPAVEKALQLWWRTALRSCRRKQPPSAPLLTQNPLIACSSLSISACRVNGYSYAPVRNAVRMSVRQRVGHRRHAELPGARRAFIILRRSGGCCEYERPLLAPLLTQNSCVGTQHTFVLCGPFQRLCAC